MFLQNFFNMQHTLVCKRNALVFFVQLIVAGNNFALGFVRIIAGFRIFFGFYKLAYVFINFVIFKCIIFALT